MVVSVVGLSTGGGHCLAAAVRGTVFGGAMSAVGAVLNAGSVLTNWAGG